MNKTIKTLGKWVLLVILFFIINIIVVTSWPFKQNIIPPPPPHEENPALVYLCTIQNKTAFFDKVLYSDKSVPIVYSKGDVVPTFSNLGLTWSGRPVAEAIIVVVDKKTQVSGPITNHIVNEYFVRNGRVEGLGNIPLDQAIEWACRISQNAGR
jgi:hypothetical protein